MVRVAGLKRRIAAGIAVRAASGLSPREVHDAVLVHAHDLMRRQAECWSDEVRASFGRRGHHIGPLGRTRRTRTAPNSRRCSGTRSTVLTPLTVDPAHPFPTSPARRSTSPWWCATPRPKSTRPGQGAARLPRFLGIRGRGHGLMAEDLDMLVPRDVIAAHHFSVTRNLNLEVEEDDAENPLTALRAVSRRRSGPPVRLEVDDQIDDPSWTCWSVNWGWRHQYSMPGPWTCAGSTLRRDPTARTSCVWCRGPMPIAAERRAPRRLTCQHRQERRAAPPPMTCSRPSVQRFLSKRPQIRGARDQADRCTDLRRQPDHRRPHRCRRGRKQVLRSWEIKARFDERTPSSGRENSNAPASTSSTDWSV